ncbi:hypothetical protein B0182_02000 [Moraxella bovis]|nr:hypothetical protein B0182_02000 [Moraxella bovis]
MNAKFKNTLPTLSISPKCPISSRNKRLMTAFLAIGFFSDFNHSSNCSVFSIVNIKLLFLSIVACKLQNYKLIFQFFQNPKKHLPKPLIFMYH